MNKQPPEVLKHARARLLHKAVFFASILYDRMKLHWVRDGELFQGAPIPTAMCDGRNIVVNLDFFDRLKTVDERLFVLAHEVYHAMAMHPTRMKSYHQSGLFGYEFDPMLYNYAADGVINVCLTESRIGTKPPVGVLIDPKYLDGYKITGMESAEDIYEKLLHTAQKQGHGSGPGAARKMLGGSAPGEGDPMSGDVQTPSQAVAAEISEAEMRVAIQAAASAAKAQGNLPAHLKSFVDELGEGQIPWQERLRLSVVSRAGSERYTWSRANRRKLVSPGVYIPRRVSMRCGPVVCAIDTSGSVSDQDLQAFLAEVASILTDVTPESLHVIWCDAVVERVDHVESADDLLLLTRTEGVPGRGGTSFVPPFEYLREHQMECETFVYLTDGYGPFPSAELVPPHTLWVINSTVKAPVGETLHIY